MTDELPAGVAELIPAYLGAQRWYSGSIVPDSASVTVERGSELWSVDGGTPRLWQAIVSVGPDWYHLLVGERPGGEPDEFLHGHDEAVLGVAGDHYFYDAAFDSELAKALLTVASDGAESAVWARPLPVEQSNTSLVYDDRLILKIFRRLRPGANPDVEVTTALAQAGFAHLAAPLVSWRDDRFDLAFGQQFLAGGAEGWALALTSLRDLFSGDSELPGEAGGDFGSEAERLGRVTAEMHIAMARVFGQAASADASVRWAAIADSLRPRLAEASEAIGLDLLKRGAPLLERLDRVTDPGPFFRVHGDYHLGQVMRTDIGWHVLDFEGEPTKSVEERTAPSSPIKDVTGMLRSFHYAGRRGLGEHPDRDRESLEPRAEAWEVHNRQAFLDGYQGVDGIHDLLPDAPTSAVLMAAYQLDKALYELDYERAHRPEWVSIPTDALVRLVEGGERGRD